MIKVLHNVSLLKSYGNYIIIAVFAVFIAGFTASEAQINNASSANWIYPSGNTFGTKHVPRVSGSQDLDSFRLKWSTNLIAGDVQPLIGNLVNNPAFRSGFTAPNEMTAVVGDEIIIIDGLGKLVTRTEFPVFVNGVKGISVLLDTLTETIGNNPTRPLVIALETMEFSPEDSIATAYIAGYSEETGRVEILNRLAVDLRQFQPNVFASIKPVFAKRNAGSLYIYATVNTANPTIPEDFSSGFSNAPYFRGFTQFNTENQLSSFPLPDVGDDINNRYTLGPEVSFAQPSIAALPNGINGALIPSFGSNSFPATQIPNPNGLISTFSDSPYLFGYDISDGFIFEDILPTDLSAFMDSRPRVHPYYVDITDAETGDNMFILVAEEYNGIDGSQGTSKLHLYDINGNPITFTSLPDVLISPPVQGAENHFWSVATGNVDGRDNEWLPYYPNNPGKEIIVTQSSRDFAFPNSKLSVLRYFSGLEIEKPTPSNDFLFPFDTIFTTRINGWVAAVNDLDGNPDGKEEIVLVDGSTLRIVRVKDYESVDFRLGNPLDTVFTHTFRNQTISHVSIADLEGDGLNDVIVTTYDSTYVIGSIISNTLDLLLPDDSITDFCAGDTINFVWHNIIDHESNVRIRFVETIDEVPVGDTTYIVAEGINNRADTVRYDYPVDLSFAGMSGFFIVELEGRPQSVNDATPIFNFFAPSISLDALTSDTYYVGSTITLQGEAACSDSVKLEYIDLNGNVFELDSGAVDFDGFYQLSAEIPCLDIFNCSSQDQDSTMTLYVISDKAGYSDTLSFVINIMPYPLPINWELPTTADPTLTFRRGEEDFDYPCDDISILVSLDEGESFSLIGNINSQIEEYVWSIPLDVPDSLFFRFCCENSCVRVDTTIKGFKPNFIGIVAPNPFQPPFETAEIVYRVPEETNVTIRIIDQANRVVKELVRGETKLPNVAYSTQWDGRIDSNGAMAHNGMYYIVLEISSGAREIYPIYIRK